MKPIRVALADDHPVVLAGIKALLRADPLITLVGEAATGSDALGVFCRIQPDVAVIDISLPELNGIELARRMAEKCPDVKLLALTVHEDRAYVQPLLQAGARGYLLKRSAAEDLVRAIRAVAEGGIYLDPAVADKALPDLAAPRNGSSAAGRGGEGELSAREEEVLKLTAQGFANKEIAGRLDVSVKTVETYKARGAEKLGLRSRAEIVRFGAAQGWLGGLDMA
ncbi:MAG TPA: response regulator transcription factor [Mesorhizobium sp.]|jgi:DNA-binding NarL/FixJ family response regulator|nr:response regulator transcription factor [Mesorhizobium sp.]